MEEGLIKEGIQCVAFIAPEDQRKLVDFEATALREGAALHRKAKAELKALGVQLVPLMLVQVDSTKDTAARRNPNFALGRLIETIGEAKLAGAAGQSGDWRSRMDRPKSAGTLPA